jgi:hypothetical protein
MLIKGKLKVHVDYLFHCDGFLQRSPLDLLSLGL